MPDPAAIPPDPENRKTASGQATTIPVPTPAPRRRPIPVTADFVASLVTGPDAISFPLPDGRTARGTIAQRQLATNGSPAGASGTLEAPANGSFIFRIQPRNSPTGPVAGAITIGSGELAFRVLAGPGNISLLTEVPADEVVCRRYALPPGETEQPRQIPAEHPTSIPIPTYQNGVIPLQGRPGATGVIYLDFDGEPGPHEGWSNFDAAPSNASNTQIKDVWIRVCEDFAPFNLNVTTDLQVYLNAPQTSRQRCIITPTTTASPGAGGVAWVGSFAMSGDIPCWAFALTGKNAAEVISHEIGHTLGLYHDGRTTPFEYYYLGHGTDPVGWAPIMGAGYYKNLSQWSKGEYLSANQIQNDVATIASNPNVGYRTDDAGATHASAALLEIFNGGVVNSQGTIETQTDVDAFRFTTTGGSVNLSVSTVPAGPDLDIQASIHDASGTVILSNNPSNSINAALVTSLPAGEYTVRVDGVGRGSALVDGYTDYGSLGQYTITGTIAGAAAPDRLTLAENPPLGTAVGTTTPRINHGGAPLIYSITAGNAGSAFSINPTTGAITVATPSALNYEALGTSWTSPPALILTVTVVDTQNPALNESLRVVVSVTNVNEPPVIAGASSMVAIAHTVNDTVLGTVTASDPDPFDFPVYSIPSGNTAGKFSISPSGLIRVSGDLDSSVQSSWPLVIRASDHGTPPLVADLPVTVTIIPAAAQFTPGFVRHTLYEGVNGSNTSNLTKSPNYPTKPTREVRLTDFTDNTQGDDYGSTIRAWLIAPHTGTYQFWVSGDQAADLYFSAAGDPDSASRICYLASSSSYQQWDKSSTQHSAGFQLTAGQVCYIEALHKESSGADHLSVAWRIDDLSGSPLVPQSVIPGKFLSPHHLNYAPEVPAGTVNLYRNSYAGQEVVVPVVSDLNPADTHSWAITGGNSAGIFAINANSGRITVANSQALAAHGPASVTLTLTTTDNGAGTLSASGPMTINLLAPTAAPTAGLIQEFWDYVVGTQLTALDALPRFPDRPDHLTDLTTFDSGSGITDNYGARIRAYVIPPVSGSYTFHISSDNNGALFLSPDANPVNAVQIATVETYSSYQTWNAYDSQTSAPVTLTAGQRYFIEGRVKEGTGSDHLSVAWKGPSIPTITLIGDADTEPYDSNVAPAFGAGSYSLALPAGFTNNTVAGTVTATDSPFEQIRYAIISGNPADAFVIDPLTGVISVGNASNLAAATTHHLQVGAQDSGHGRHFAPRESLVAVDITVPPPDPPPEFSANPISLGSFPAKLPLAASIAPFVSDPGDILTFAMASGPAWLSLSSDGSLSGTPDFTQFGLHEIRVSVSDSHGHGVEGNVTLVVSAPAAGAGSGLTAADSSPSLSIGTVLSGNSNQASASDNTYLTFRETASPGTSSLDYRWTFTTPPHATVDLLVEAHHTVNSEGDDFRFMISTDGGVSFTDAILITKTSDDDAPQTATFTTGSGPTTIIRVVDTNRTPGNNSLDLLYLDLLALQIHGNNPPAVVDADFQVASHAPVGVSIGNVTATDPDSGQSLSLTISRGNEAGHFAVSPQGNLIVTSDIPADSGPFRLTVVATDNGTPPLANYATVTLSVIDPVTATNLIISEGETFEAAAEGATYQLLINHGTLTSGAGTLHITTDAINHGVLRLTRDAALDVSGSFTNTGIIDIINWNGTLPDDLINAGTILDGTSVRVLFVENDALHLRFGIPGFTGHRYQLQSTPALDVPWTSLGDPVPGSGSLAAPPILEFSPPRDGLRRFYRVQVTPDP